MPDDASTQWAAPDPSPAGHPAPVVYRFDPVPGGEGLSRRAKIWVAVVVVGVLVFLVAVGWFAYSQLTERNSGPFTGVYRATFAAATSLDGQRRSNDLPAKSAEFAVRSICRSDGCLAVAELRDGEMYAPSFVFDEIDRRWVAVATRHAPVCTDAVGEAWEIITLTAAPDGTLTGDYLLLEANGVCSARQAVTFTRSGDLFLPDDGDPADLPALRRSPAAGVTGRYRNVVSASWHYDVTTDYQAVTGCERGGTRCLTYFYATAAAEPLLFSADRWTQDLTYDANCPGGTAVINSHLEIPAPQQWQDPVRMLSGRGVNESSDPSCAGEFRASFERIGD